MQRLEVSCAVGRIYTSLGAKGVNPLISITDRQCFLYETKIVIRCSFTDSASKQTVNTDTRILQVGKTKIRVLLKIN